MLQPGDIVIASFPQNDGGAKKRPGIIVEVALDDDGRGVFVRLAYGTSRGADRRAAWEFSIGPDDGSAWAASGLLLPTKFEFNTFLWVSESECRRVGVVSHAIGGRLMAAIRAARANGYLT